MAPLSLGKKVLENPGCGEGEAELEVTLARGELSARDCCLQPPHLFKKELGNQKAEDPYPVRVMGSSSTSCSRRQGGAALGQWSVVGMWHHGKQLI